MHENEKKTKIFSVVNLILGALAFVVLLDGLWFWVGFISAIAALVLGRAGWKRPHKASQRCAVISIILAVGAAVSYLMCMFAQGYSMPNIL